MKTFKLYYENAERVRQIKELQAMIKDPDPKMVAMYGGDKYVQLLKNKVSKLIGLRQHDLESYSSPGREESLNKLLKSFKNNEEEDAQDRCKRKADQVYGKKTSAYKSGAIVRCRKGKIWKKK
jgi:hypothetical protein